MKRPVSVREAASYFSSRSIVERRSGLALYWPFKCQHEKEFYEKQVNFGIECVYEPEAFEIEIAGIKCHWIPDFYFPETNEYVELNCRPPAPKKRKKIAAFQSQCPLLRLQEVNVPRSVAKNPLQGDSAGPQNPEKVSEPQT